MSSHSQIMSHCGCPHCVFLHEFHMHLFLCLFVCFHQCVCAKYMESVMSKNTCRVQIQTSVISGTRSHFAMPNNSYTRR